MLTKDNINTNLNFAYLYKDLIQYKKISLLTMKGQTV